MSDLRVAMNTVNAATLQFVQETLANSLEEVANSIFTAYQDTKPDSAASDTLFTIYESIDNQVKSLRGETEDEDDEGDGPVVEN